MMRKLARNRIGIGSIALLLASFITLWLSSCPTTGEEKQPIFAVVTNGHYSKLTTGATIRAGKVALFTPDGFASLTDDSKKSSETGSIYYTVDGSKPSEKSLVYKGAIDPIKLGLNGAYTIMAIYIDAKGSSPIVTLKFTLQIVGNVGISNVAISTKAGTYNNDINPTVSCATAGVALRYTLDGSEPSESDGTSISSDTPIVINKSSTLKVIAYKSGLPSKKASAIYTIEVAPLILTEVGGTYNNKVTAKVSCVTQGASIRYTLDGSTPTKSTGTSAVTGDDIVIEKTSVLKMFAFHDEYDSLPIKKESYTMEVAPLTLSKSGGTYHNDFTTVVSSATQGVAIHYTDNLGDPTATSATIPANGEKVIDKGIILKMIALKDGYTPSAIKKEIFTLEVSPLTITGNNVVLSEFTDVTIGCPTTGVSMRYTVGNGEIEPTTTSGKLE